MENYCAFSKNHKCLNWTDYELTRYELEEAGSLCQANWIEIERKNEYFANHKAQNSCSKFKIRSKCYT